MSNEGLKQWEQLPPRSRAVIKLVDDLIKLHFDLGSSDPSMLAAILSYNSIIVDSALEELQADEIQNIQNIVKGLLSVGGNRESIIAELKNKRILPQIV